MAELMALLDDLGLLAKYRYMYLQQPRPVGIRAWA
jgi:hypothetical protein